MDETTLRTNPSFFEFACDPRFDAHEFINGFVARARVSPFAALVGMFYIYRLVRSNERLKMTCANATRLMVVATCAAAKFIDDQALRYTNRHWSLFCGRWLSAAKFSMMEREFYALLDYNISVDAAALSAFCAQFGLVLPTFVVPFLP